MTARVAIAAGYFPAYAKLPRKAQRKADEFIRKFTTDPKQPSIHYEPLHATADRQLRSVRIGDDYRAIIRAPEAGDVFLLLWVDHHDEAYRWAQSKQVQVHPSTGTLQVFDLDAVSRAVTAAAEAPGGAGPAKGRPEREGASRSQRRGGADTQGASEDDDTDGYEGKRLFSDFTDEQLFVGGLPRPLVPAVRALYTDADLDRLVPHLPDEARDLLTGLAAGFDYDAVIQEILDKPQASAGEAKQKAKSVPPPLDPTDIGAALERESSQREFRLFDESFDLDKALTYPLDVWRVYLHPTQRKVARAQTKGPMRVTGGAGTGKTVVAMHRAAFLVREVFKGPDDRVLFTTFTRNLAQDIRDQLAKLLEPDQLARVEIQNIDAWAGQFLRDRGKPMRLAGREHTDKAWRSAIDLYGVDGFERAFCQAEWEKVIQEQDLRDVGAYARAVRKYRGKPLSRPERRRLWEVFEEYRSALASQGVAEAVDILRSARKELEATQAPPRYRSVIVDEAQDLGGEALRLIRTIAGPERANDLFLVGDAHQRIYGHPVSLSQAGINVRGRRSHELRINYRTTAAISRWAYGILGRGDYDDLDEGKVHGRGYVSLRSGNRPIVRRFEHLADERDFVVAEVRQLVDEGTLPEAICVVARAKSMLTGTYGPALESAGIDYEILEREPPRRSSVRLATMHRVKGLEFPIMLVTSVTEGMIPYKSDAEADDPVLSSLAEARERCLLYVAASRARDALYVTSYGTPSPFLAGLDATETAATRQTARPPQAEAPSPAELDGKQDEAEANEDVWDSLVAQVVDSWPLPARMLNWCSRKEIGVIGDFVVQDPLDLLSERNLGRKTVAETRRLIELRFGLPWEDVRRRVRRLSGDAETSDDAGPSDDAGASTVPSGWAGLQAVVPAEVAVIPVAELKLPTRLTNYCKRERLATLGELVAIPKHTLAVAKNLGRASIQEGERAIREFVENVAVRRAMWAEGLLASWKNALQGLDAIPRMVVTRRAGLGGRPETLESIAETLGVSRERVRQIESKVIGRLRTEGAWLDYLRGRFEERLNAAGGALLVERLEEDSWWGGFESRTPALDYFCERMLDGAYRIVEFEGEEYLARVAKPDLAEAWRTLQSRAAALSYPATLPDVERLARAVTDQLGETLSRRLWEQLQEYLQVEEPSTAEAEPTVVAFGTGKEPRILAMLRASETPVPISEIQAEIGRFVVPTEAMYFDRGLIGLEQHFPDFQSWLAKVPPVVVSLMEATGPERQYSCMELIDDVREAIELPAWMNHWHLASLLRRSTQVDYLGRLRVALPGVADRGGRVKVREHFVQILREAGGPLPAENVLEAAAKLIDFRDFHGSYVLMHPPFVRIDGNTVGLVERDLPGGAAAIEEATEQLETVLHRRDRGLTAFQVQSELSILSVAHAQWSQEMCLSVLRGQPEFRLSRSGNVGLSEWETVRVPLRVELFRKSLEEGGGRVSVEAVESRIAALYGDRPSRNDIGWMAFNAGARLDGDWAVEK